MLSDIGSKIFNLKYAAVTGETWGQAVTRICMDVVDENLEDNINLLYNLYFLPGGRIIKNAGTNTKNLYNCFFFNLGDSRDSIYQCLKDAAEIFAWGGGVGLRFSDLREQGALIKSTNTASSGPVSFMELFNLTGDVIQQASRRAAEIALLDISHPDIRKFIRSKSTISSNSQKIVRDYTRLSGESKNESLETALVENQLSHFNISVEIPDDFMKAVGNGGNWNLISPSTKEVVETLPARDLLYEISTHIWESGDPGVFFTDAVNKDNMVKYISNTMGCNPCGEINLLSYEPCNLGSINLHALVENESINFDALENTVRMGVRFLDSVHDKSDIRVPKVIEMSKGLRRIGLGVMGFADLLAELELPYDSDKAFEVAEYLSWFVTYYSWMESFNMAIDKGAFPFYDPEQADLTVFEKVMHTNYVPTYDIEEFRKIGPRNVSVTALAPTGTISLLAGVNSTIEPFFSLAYKRFITLGEGNSIKDSIIEVNPILFKKLNKYGVAVTETMKRDILEAGSIQNIKGIPSRLKDIFKNAHEINPEAHVYMQSAWQTYVSNAISKTINVPSNITPDAIFNLLMLVWEKGLKSSTIYRNNSKSFQILNAGVE